MSDIYEKLSGKTEPYIIVDIGANHNGDMELAKKLIRSAKLNGAHAIKFQSWTPESLIAKEEYDRNQKYDDSPKKHFGSLREMVEKYYLRPEQHIGLKEYCDSIGINFCSTPFSMEEVDLLESLNTLFFKVASMDINNLVLLKYIAQKHKPVILSTGMAKLAEVEKAIDVIEKENNNQIILLHCISIYPPAYEDINLNNIVMLRKTFGYPVGFSDHTIGTCIPLASIALGCCMIEKHFTLDKKLPGWDHEISANPTELKIIVEESKKVAKSLGSFQKTISRAEEEKKLKFRRSVVANKDFKKGEVINKDDILFKRPGTGIHPDELKYVINRKVIRKINKDEVINWKDLI